MISKHAVIRMQQRAIPPLMIDLLYRYGREENQNGSTVLFLDKRGRRQIRNALKETLNRFDKLGDTYLVASADDGIAITVGHRNKRINRK